MKRIAISTSVLVFAASSALTACEDGPEGTYMLDEEATVAALRSRFPQSSGLLGVNKATIDLRPGGEYRMTMSRGGFRTEEEQSTDTGTWKADGAKLKLQGSERELSCKLNDTKRELECDGKGTAITRERESPIIFKRY